MIIWSTVYTSKSPEDFNQELQFEEDDWQKLKSNFLSQNHIDLSRLHPQRLQSFYLSRLALKKAIPFFLDDGNHQTFSVDQLQMKSHGKLVSFPELSITLTHTHGAAAAAVRKHSSLIETNHENQSLFQKLDSTKTIQTLGIDMEHKSRVVNKAVMEKISHPLDLHVGPIENWCLKEAIYKCLMNTELFDQSFYFKDIQLKDRTWVLNSRTLDQMCFDIQLEGFWSIQYQNDFIIAISSFN